MSGHSLNRDLQELDASRGGIQSNLSVKTGYDLDVESGATFSIAGTAVTATAAELNAVDGVTATVANLNLTAAGGQSGTAAGRGPSPLVWDDCNVLQFMMDPTDGWVYMNDFVDGGYVLANNQSATHLNQGVVGFTAATGATVISQNTDEPTGVVTLACTTDNEDCGISVCGGVNTAGQIKLTTGKQFWMEARVKSLNITDAKFGIFFGLAEEGLSSAGGLIDNADALTDKDYVGFHKLAADGDKFDTVFNTASGGTTPISIKADAVTIEADTYIKLGMHCDGTTLRFYADGVLLADSIAIAATDFPDGEEMAVYFVAMNAHGDAAESSIDWIRVASEY